MTITGAPPEVTAPKTQAAARPLRSRYILAVLLLIVAVVGAAGWAFARSQASDSDYFRNTHGTVPGTVAVEAHPGSFAVFSEGGTLTSLRVTDATGTTIPVTMNTPPKSMPNYGGYTIKEVARFDVKPGSDPPGPWRVAVTGSAQAFAVGEYGNSSELGVDVWGIAALLVVNVGAAAVIVFVPIIRQRRLARRI